MKKTSSLIEDKRKDKAQRTYTCQNPKRHIPLVSLLLWHKMVTVCCFIWPLTLRLWSVSEAVRLKFKFWQFLKILYPATCKCFLLYVMLFYISRHTIYVVRPITTSAGTRQTSVYFTGTKKMPFSRIHILKVARQKLIIFVVETPSG